MRADAIRRRRRRGWLVALPALAAFAALAAVLTMAGLAAGKPAAALAAAQSGTPRPQVGGDLHARPPGAPAAPGAPASGGGHLAGLPAAAPSDVSSPDAVIAAYYQSLSGPAGKKRDWNRFLSLFFPGARLLPAEGRGHGGKMPEMFSADSYLYNTEPSMLATGYIEKEISRRTLAFGKVVQAWSAYKVLHAESDTKPFVRGINGFQLFFDGSRWWIFSLVWQPEAAQLTLPQEYLR